MGKKISFAKPKKARQVPDAPDSWVSSGDPREQKESKPEPAAQVPMKRLTIDVPMDLHQRVKIGCAKRGLKMADEIRKLLEKEFPE